MSRSALSLVLALALLAAPVLGQASGPAASAPSDATAPPASDDDATRTSEWRKARLVGTVVTDDLRVAIFQLHGEPAQRIFRIGDVVMDATIVDIAAGAILAEIGERRFKLFVFTDEVVESVGVVRAAPVEWDLPRAEAERAIRTGEMVIETLRDGVSAAAATGMPTEAVLPPVAGEPGGTFDIDPNVLAELGIDPNTQLSAAQIVSAVNRALRTMQVQPHISGGQPDGFLITNLKPGGPAESIGLRNGDIIRAVNGYRISTVQDVFQVYMRVRNDTEFNVEIEREGSLITRTYSVGER